MKFLRSLLCLSFALLVAETQALSQIPQRRELTSSQANAAQLQLSTSIIEQQYADRGGALRLGLDLTYSNTGNVPVLVYKESTWVYRILISGSLKKALEKKYDYDARLSFITVREMRAAGMHPVGEEPAREAFVMLRPGESHSVRQEILLDLYDGTKDTRDALHPGDHYLRLKVATWYYFADPEAYQEKWKDEGFVWSKDITSEPMRLSIRRAW